MKTRLRRRRWFELSEKGDMMRGMLVAGALILGLVFLLGYLFPPPPP